MHSSVKKKTKQERLRRFVRGLWAERWAALFLRIKGYRIENMRYKTPVGEIDIVARRGGTLVAVEVKARPSFYEGAQAISDHQKRRITRAMEWYVQQRHIQNHPPHTVRFDVILIKPWRWPRHLCHAWGHE